MNLIIKFSLVSVRISKGALYFIMLFVLQVVYFTNSGSESNDLALTMAKLYTGADDIVGLRYVFSLIHFLNQLQYIIIAGRGLNITDAFFITCLHL